MERSTSVPPNIGSTEDMANRAEEHRAKTRGGFTAKYGVSILVWYQAHDTREAAFALERRMKRWNRAWKIALIERFNPGWRDLSRELS
jgi:putative endonuclease